MMDPRSSLDARRRTALRAVRTFMPDQAQEAVRSTVRGFGQLTASSRMLPGLIVAGAQRCGTTTLYRMLEGHPAIVRPLFHKGIGYFDVGYQHPFSWYQGHFPLAAAAAGRHKGVGACMTFDSSGYYMFHPLAPTRIAERLPDVKVVVLLRDPVERAYSAHRHELVRGFETEDFERALELEPERLAGEVDRMRRDPAYHSFHHRHHAYVGRGQYAPQIRALQNALSPAQIHVMDAHDLFQEPVEQFARLQEWLGLPVHRPSHVEHANAQPRVDMPSGLRLRLAEQFEEADLELAELLQAAPSWRR